MSRTQICTGHGYLIEGEEIQGCTFLHCDIKHFSKSVMREIRDAFEIIVSEFKALGKELLFSYTKNERFIKFLGVPYKSLADITESGETHKVISWELK